MSLAFLLGLKGARITMIDLEDQLIQKYENLLLKAQKYKIPEREMTIFDTALKNHHENPITELLSFFLDPNEKHGLGAGFYNGFVTSLNATEEYADFDFGQFLELSTQQTTDKGNRIDLWFETDTALVVVEVKVHHHQNNPFPDYVSWGKKRLKEINQSCKKEEYSTEKQLVTLVLCPDGECYADHWLGLAYNDLTSEIRIALAHDIFKNPLNKWGVFARDFLLHLDSFVDLLGTNMESLNFVVDHMQQIQQLVELRENVYQEIIDHINNELQTALGEKYEPYVRRHTWNRTPAFRFVGNNWKEWSESVLNLHIDKDPMSYSVVMYIQNPTQEILKKVKQSLKKSPHQFSKEWHEGKDNEFWGVRWEFSKFDLEEATQFIVFIHKILNQVELEWK